MEGGGWEGGGEGGKKISPYPGFLFSTQDRLFAAFRTG